MAEQNHPRDSQLLDLLAAGEQAAHPDLRKHLEECALCRSRLDRFAQMWDLTAQASPHDISQWCADLPLPGRRPALWTAWYARAAAVIALAVLTGFAAGRFSRVGPSPDGGNHQLVAAPAEVAAAMHLDLLSADPVGLDRIWPLPSQTPQEAQP